MKKILWAVVALVLVGGISVYVWHYTTTPRASVTRNLAVGDADEVNGLKIILANVSQDSRCPAGVYCIQAGKLVANIRLIVGTQKKDTVINSPGDPIKFAGYTVAIAVISPLKVASRTVNQSEYRISFSITKI